MQRRDAKRSVSMVSNEFCDAGEGARIHQNLRFYGGWERRKGEISAPFCGVRYVRAKGTSRVILGHDVKCFASPLYTFRNRNWSNGCMGEPTRLDWPKRG